MACLQKGYKIRRKEYEMRRKMRMKRMTILLAMVLAIAMTFSCGLAEEKAMTTYHLEKVGVSFEMEADIPTFMVGDTELDSFFTKRGYTLENLEMALKSNAIDFLAMPYNGAVEFRLNGASLVETDLVNADAEKREEMLADIRTQYEALNATIKTIEVVELSTGPAFFIRYSENMGTMVQYTTQYTLLDSNRLVNLRLCSYNTWLSSTKEEWLKKVAESVKWDAVSEATVTAAPTAEPEGNVSVRLEDLKLTVEIPARFPHYVYGDETISDYYSARGISKYYMDTLMEPNHMYMHALSSANSEMLFIGLPMDENETSQMTGEDMETAMAQMKLSFESAGATVTETVIVETRLGPAIHACYNIKTSGVTQYCEQYTIVGRWSMATVRIATYSGPATEEESKMLLDITESIRWDEAKAE